MAVEKGKVSDATYRKANRKKCRAWAAKWAKAHPEKVKAWIAKWRKANSERVRTYNTEYHKENREKEKVRRAKLYEENPERKKAPLVKYRKANRGKLREKSLKYYRANPEREKMRRAEYCKANPEKCVVLAARHRALKFANTPIDELLTSTEWLAILTEANGHCHYCGKEAKLTIDHVIPLSRGGKDTKNNVVAVCKHCNSSKGNKALEKWNTPTYQWLVQGSQCLALSVN
jgi:5-methylcytosine-specific restriction endonuclease McrA